MFGFVFECQVYPFLSGLKALQASIRYILQSVRLNLIDCDYVYFYSTAFIDLGVYDQIKVTSNNKVLVFIFRAKRLKFF